MEPFGGGADFAFKNNVPDPLLAGKELPTFKFELEKSEGKVDRRQLRQGGDRQAAAHLQGDRRRLDAAGARRACASCTGTPPPPSGPSSSRAASAPRSSTRTADSETNDFDPGDVWYFPRGHGHMLQCLGDKPCHFILIFDNGYFSEFGTFSITDWIGHTPKALLAKNFGLPESAFDGFPKEEVYFARGPVPPEEAPPHLQGSKTPPHDAQVPSCSRRSRTRSTRGAASGGSDSTASRSRRRSPAWSSTSSPAASASCTGTPTPTSGSTSSRARSASPCSARTAATGPRRWTKGDVGYIPQGYGHSIENVGDEAVPGPDRLQHRASTRRSTCRSGSPATRADVLATNFGKPATLFEKFPHDRVFIAPPDGSGQREVK